MLPPSYQSILGIVWEDVVHILLVARPQRGAAAARHDNRSTRYPVLKQNNIVIVDLHLQVTHKP